MALSNLLNEPQREITETVVGIAAIVPFGILDYYTATWIYKPGKDDFIFLLFFTTIFIFLCLFVLIIAAILIHLLGEFICNTLDRHGLHLRPTRPLQG